MEAHEIVATVAGSSVPVGSILGWIAKKVFRDLKGLSIKIESLEERTQEKICDLEVQQASMNERIKTLEKIK